MRHVFFVSAVALLAAACATKPAVERACYHASAAIEQDLGYCQAVRVGDTLHISGSVGAGAMPEAITQAYAQIEATLAAHGLSFADVVKETVFTTDMEALIAHQDVRKAYYGAIFPASSWVQVERLYLSEFTIEVEATAVFGRAD